MHAKLIKVIETTLTKRGSGKDVASPVRIVTQYWSEDGKLLAEVDPLAAISAPENSITGERELLELRDRMKDISIPLNPFP